MWCIYAHIYGHIFIIHSFLSGPLGSFHVTPTVNNAEMNMRGQITLRDSNFSSFSDISRCGITGLYGSTFNFLSKTSILLYIVAVPIYIPTSSPQGLPFPHISGHTYHNLFDTSHLTGVRWYLIVVLTLFAFLYLFDYSDIFFGKRSIQVLCPFFNQIIWDFAIKWYEFLVYLGY